MKKLFCSFLSFLILYTGCSSTYTFRHNLSDYLELNEKLEGKKATMTLIDDSIIVRENVFIGPDSTFWFESDYPRIWSTKKIISTSAIKQVEINNRKKSALIGGIIGIIIGSAGFIYKYESSEEKKLKEIEKEYGLGAFFVLIGEASLWMGIGAAAGYLTGSLVGYPERYNFSASQDSSNMNSKVNVHIE